MADESNRIYLARMAELLGRSQQTVRQWIKRTDLPKKLQPHRVSGRQTIYWEASQLDGMKAYADERAANRGWPGSRTAAT